jgi:hypothetical protein
MKAILPRSSARSLTRDAELVGDLDLKGSLPCPLRHRPDGDGKVANKPFIAMLLLIVLIVACEDSEAATQRQYDSVTRGVRHAIEDFRHQLPKRVDEVTTLTNAYIDPNDDRKAVFVSTLDVTKSDIDRRKWQDLGRKLRNQACADDLFKDSIEHGYVSVLYRYIDQHGQRIGEFLIKNC